MEKSAPIGDNLAASIYPQDKARTELERSSPKTSQRNEVDPPGYRREIGPNGEVNFVDSVGLRVELRGDVSPEFQERMLREIQNIPESDRRRLAERGVSVAIVGTVPDLDPALARERPRNWPSNRTYADSDGVFISNHESLGNVIVVAERTRSGPSNRAEGVLRHETGHAMNFVFAEYSNHPDFQRAYDEDLRNMTPAQRRQMDYWMRRPGGAGRDETFADLYAALRGGTPNSQDSQMLLSRFPRVAALIQQRLSVIGRVR